MLGDKSVGKSSLQFRFENGTFPTEYIPTIFSSCAPLLIVDNIAFKIGIWDTSSNEDYDRFRPLSYPQTDVFLLCFSLVSKKSLQNIETKWFKEVQAYCPGTPCILVGLKCDLIKNNEAIQNGTDSNDEINDLSKDKLPISFEYIQEMKEKVNAEQYFECSSLENTNVKEIFEYACKIMIRSHEDASPTNSKCNIS